VAVIEIAPVGSMILEVGVSSLGGRLLELAGADVVPDRQPVHVEQAGASLAGLRTVLQDDNRIGKLLTTPLMLSIAALAYKGRSADEIPSSSTVDEHRAHLFAAYTKAMFQRRAKATAYTREQTEHWLMWLATSLFPTGIPRRKPPNGWPRVVRSLMSD
jgi:hypothetical protein